MEAKKPKGYPVKRVEKFEGIKKLDSINKETIDNLLGEPVLVHTKHGILLGGTIFNADERGFSMHFFHHSMPLRAITAFYLYTIISDIYVLNNYKEATKVYG